MRPGHAVTCMKSLLCILFLIPLSAFAVPHVIDDEALTRSLEKGLGKVADQGDFPTADDLSKALDDVPAKWTSSVPFEPAGKSPADRSESVYLITSVYKCGNCDKWHRAGVATAWAVTHDGLMITNRHVFEKIEGGAMGVCDREGNVWPVKELVAASPVDDVALFRVEAQDLKPLAIGHTASEGSRVHVVSHPDGRYYFQTFGEVSRYHNARSGKNGKCVAMSITADYAKGSSGGPVMNLQGEVVGMVSSTQSIYYDSSNGKPKGPLQMVVKNCVPVTAIRGILGLEE